MSNEPPGFDAGSMLGVESNATPSAPSPERSEADARLALDESRRYERRATLGVGGMGRVVMARDHRLDRDVALKEVMPLADAFARAQLEARLAREAAVTARLEHPNIVPVYDAGRGADGRIFYTMRVIRGRSLSEVVRATADPDARLRLMRHVLDACQAVAWAHRHGVVHRDLKPANIMIGELGETQVVDWGLARLVDEPESGADGTPHYMAPEQARGCADARSDVWALGYVIAEVVSGEIAQPRLSNLPPELAAIVRRATMPSPADRYADAKAMADDVAAWLDGRRVAAHDYSTWELVRRLVRAWRVPLAIAFLALVAVAVAIGVGFSETAAERDRAEAARQRASDAEARTTLALARAEVELGRAQVGSARTLMADDARPEAELTAVTALVHEDSAEARGLVASLFASARPTRVWSRAVPTCHVLTMTSDGRLGLCHHADALELWDLERTERRWRAPIESAWSVYLEGPEPLVLYQPVDTLTTGILDARTGRVVAPIHECCIALHARRDGREAIGIVAQELMLVRGARDFVRGRLPCSAAGGDHQDQPRMWVAGCTTGGYLIAFDDAEPVLRTLTLGEGEHVTALALVPGRAEAVLGTNKGQVLLMDLAADRVVRSASGSVGVIGAVEVSLDGRLAALRDEHAGVRIWDVATAAWRGRLPAHVARGMRWLDASPHRLVTWGTHEAVAWDLPIERPATVPLGGGVSALDITADRIAVAAGTNAEVYALDGRRILSVGEDAIVKAVVLDAPGERVAVGVALPERAVDRIDLRDATRTTIGSAGFVRRMNRLADGTLLRAPNWGPLSLLAWDGDERALLEAHVVHDVTLTADARRAAMLVGQGELRALSFAPPSARAVADDIEWSAVAASNDGAWFACAVNGGVWLLDELGDERGWLAADADLPIIDVAWSPDDCWVAAGGKSGAVFLWSAADRTLRAVVRDHRERVAALAFDPEGAWLATGGWDKTLRFIALAPIDKNPDELRRAVEDAWGMRYDDMGIR